MPLWDGVELNVSGLKISNSGVSDWIKLTLQTSDVNPVILANHDTFGKALLYKSYDTTNDETTSFLKASNFVVTAPSNAFGSCQTSPCVTSSTVFLHPWSDFSVAFDLTVQSFVRS